MNDIKWDQVTSRVPSAKALEKSVVRRQQTMGTSDDEGWGVTPFAEAVSEVISVG